MTKQKLSLFEETVFENVKAELLSAIDLYGSFHSAHEGFAVIQEEVDELWDLVKQRNPSKKEMNKEAIQIAAMAIRFVLDVQTPGSKPTGE